MMRPRERVATEWSVDDWDDPVGVVAVETTRRQGRIVKWVVWIGLAVVLSLVLAAGATGWWYIDRLTAGDEIGPPLQVTISSTDDVETLSVRLQEMGIVSDAEVFVRYVDWKGGLELTPGYYEIPPGDHMGNVLARLRTPPGQTYAKLTFPEGLTLEQMAVRLEDEIPRLSADAFLAAARSPGTVSSLRPPGANSLEGLLFPDTYRVSNAENEAQIVERMIALMERVSSQEDLVERAGQIGRTPYEVLIVASMIEREAKLDKDRPLIASVIYNRLFINMNLQIDATVLYGQQTRDENGDPIPFSQLRQNDTPYNTYLHTGLPPTPIANPGRASIRAALNPSPPPPAGDPVCQELADPTNCSLFFYVLADEDGGHAFASTAEQHQRNVDAAAAAGLLDG